MSVEDPVDGLYEVEVSHPPLAVRSTMPAGKPSMDSWRWMPPGNVAPDAGIELPGPLTARSYCMKLSMVSVDALAATVSKPVPTNKNIFFRGFVINMGFILSTFAEISRYFFHFAFS